MSGDVLIFTTGGALTISTRQFKDAAGHSIRHRTVQRQRVIWLKMSTVRHLPHVTQCRPQGPRLKDFICKQSNFVCACMCSRCDVVPRRVFPPLLICLFAWDRVSSLILELWWFHKSQQCSHSTVVTDARVCVSACMRMHVPRY